MLPKLKLIEKIYMLLITLNANYGSSTMNMLRSIKKKKKSKIMFVGEKY